VPQDVVGVGLLGAGTVGSALVELLTREALRERVGVGVKLVRIAVAHPDKPRPAWVPRELLSFDPNEVVEDPAVEVVVELMGGLEPARSVLLKALEAKKPVVTANKELLARHGGELFAAAAKAGVDLLFEAAVGGAIPLVRPLRESLAGERIHRVMGIVNGTTNYILTKMSEDGMSYADALAEAQQRGYAERDPSADVEGRDAAAKAAILASIAFGVEVDLADVSVEGITALTLEDIQFAKRSGFEVKLVAVAERVSDGEPPELSVRVHPAMISRSHPLASVRGVHNAVFIEGDAVGELMLLGRGAGGAPTAAAVLGDLIDAAHNLRMGAASRSPIRRPARIQPLAEQSSCFCVSVAVADRPGVLAAVAGVFGANRVSIRSMEQVDLGREARLVFVTHEAKEADMSATLAGLRHLEPVDKVGALLRVVG
jgi:homoserine dehydrogenase